VDKLFLTILNMSLTGSFVVAAICLARLSIKKAPKIIAYCLWAVAGFRLAFPISIKSAFSLIPFNAQIIPPDIATQPVPSVDSGIAFVNDAVAAVLPSSPVNIDAASINSLRLWTAVGSWVWLAGSAILLVLGVAGYIRLKNKMASAIRVEGDIYETDEIQSPFVLGVFKPKIYIPLDLSGQERNYIILHERTHIRRKDYIIKFVAYFIVCLHWFNPLIWAAFVLMGLDMEMSCDERVLTELGSGINKDYSLSLLSLAANRRVLGGSALAFGEDGVKKRIKNVLKFRKSSRVAGIVAVAFVALLSLGLMVSRTGAGGSYETQAAQASQPSQPSQLSQATGTKTATIEEDKDGNSNIAEYKETIRASSVGANAGKTYTISDYYNEDGTFSSLGLSLGEENSEKALPVSGGDIIIVGARRYEIQVESLALSFYAQPSLDQVMQWWVNYLDSWTENGKVAPV